MTTIIPVSDVARPPQPKAELRRDEALLSMLGAPAPKPADAQSQGWGPRPAPPSRRIEAVSSGTARIVAATDANALAQAAHDAFYEHYPLTLSPDAIWLCLAQGFAHHVALNAEALRARFVAHTGKKKLIVNRPDFFLGQPNPWPEAFAAFSDQIAAHVGKLRDLVVADFSTTGATERAASEVLLMDTFQPYFEYEMRCGCGIPEIRLTGTADDWRNVRRRAAVLSEFGLADWTRALQPVLDAIVDSAEGRPDKSFWRSFFRYESGSGPAELTGWIHVLFPYIKHFEGGREHLGPNPWIAGWQSSFRKADARKGWGRAGAEGPPLGAIPASVASAPVRFVDVRDGSEVMLRFVAGLFGVTQDTATMALEPEFGWAVVYEDEPSSSQKSNTQSTLPVQ